MNKQTHADITFLALILWREARGESVDAREAVGQVVMNRVRKPGWWGKDVMSVVFKRWQFSSVTDPKDQQLTKWPESSDKQWGECLDIASRCVNNQIGNIVQGGDSYYDTSIPAPYWAKQEQFVCQIGKLRFYDTNNREVK